MPLHFVHVMQNYQNRDIRFRSNEFIIFQILIDLIKTSFYIQTFPGIFHGRKPIIVAPPPIFVQLYRSLYRGPVKPAPHRGNSHWSMYISLHQKTKALQLGLLEPSSLSLLYSRDPLPKCDLVSSILQSLYLCGLVTCVFRFCPAQVLIGKALWISVTKV